MCEIVVSNFVDLCGMDIPPRAKVLVKNEGIRPFNPSGIQCKNISEIHAEKPMLYWTSDDGKMVFENVNRHLRLTMAVGNETHFDVPDNVWSIGSCAIPAQVETVTIPDSVQEICSNAFAFSKVREVTLPESVNILGETSLGSVNVVNISRPVYGLLKAMMPGHTTYFRINYRGREHLFPRVMECIEEAEKELYDETLEEGVYIHLKYAGYKRIKMACAIEMLAAGYHDAKVDQCLRKYGGKIVNMAALEGKESMIKALKILSENNVLTEEALHMALGIAERKKWVQEKAYILQMRNKGLHTSSFNC